MGDDSFNAFGGPHDTDDLESEEVAAVTARRLRQYSLQALRAALPIDQIYIHHDRFVAGLNAMDRLFQIAPDVRMPHGARLVGPTGSGKSALIRNFRERLPRSTLFAPGHGAIVVRSGARPTAGHLLSALLRAYRYPFAAVSGRTLYIKRDNLFDLMKAKGTRIVFVDEADRLLTQVRRRGESTEHPEATQLLRDMMDECNVALVLAGTAALDHLATVDSHLADRVSVRHELRYFEANQQWLGVLRGFAKQCTTFDISAITDLAEAKRLHVATEGSLRRLKRLITEAALVAAQDRKATLDVHALAQAFVVIEGQHGLRTSPYA
jgi:hypothetical protein